jgi:hypothetical protein
MLKQKEEEKSFKEIINSGKFLTDLLRSHKKKNSILLSNSISIDDESPRRKT